MTTPDNLSNPKEIIEALIDYDSIDGLKIIESWGMLNGKALERYQAYAKEKKKSKIFQHLMSLNGETPKQKKQPLSYDF